MKMNFQPFNSVNELPENETVRVKVANLSNNTIFFRDGIRFATANRIHLAHSKYEALDDHSQNDLAIIHGKVKVLEFALYPQQK